MALTKSIKALLFPKNLMLVYIRKCSLDTKLKDKTVLIPETNFQQRLLKVAVIGMPNAGKSTFINYLMDRKVKNIP